MHLLTLCVTCLVLCGEHSHPRMAYSWTQGIHDAETYARPLRKLTLDVCGAKEQAMHPMCS